jgi:hypothetical protein
MRDREQSDDLPPKLGWLPFLWYGLLGAALGTLCGWGLFQWMFWPHPESLGWCLLAGAALGAVAGAWQRKRLFNDKS